MKEKASKVIVLILNNQNASNRSAGLLFLSFSLRDIVVKIYCHRNQSLVLWRRVFECACVCVLVNVNVIEIKDKAMWQWQ